jgi:hypothetical protein
MCKDQMMRRKFWTELLGGLQQSVIIRNEYLDIIANLSYFPWRPDKIRDGTRRPVPNINWKPFPSQVPGHAASDNPKPDYTDVFARCMGHRLQALR